MAKKSSPFESFFKIIIGVALAALIFMSVMLAEQKKWIPTHIAETILGKVHDGQAEVDRAKDKAEEKEKQSDDDWFADETKDEPDASETKDEETTDSSDTQEEPEKAEAKEDESDEASSDDSSDDATSSDDSSDDAAASDDSSDDATPAKADDTKAGADSKQKKKSKKIDYAVASKKPDTWPKEVVITRSGSMIPLLDTKGKEIGKVEVPVGTRVFVKSVDAKGVLGVYGMGQKFLIHATRTNFSSLYTGEPIVIGESSSGGSESSSESSPESAPSAGSDDDFFSDDDSPKAKTPAKKSNSVFGSRKEDSDDDFDF